MPSEKHLHPIVKQLYTPNLSPDPNGWQEQKPFLNSLWDDDDYDGFQTKQQRQAKARRRLRNKVLAVGGLLALLGLAAPLAWNYTPQETQNSIKANIPDIPAWINSAKDSFYQPKKDETLEPSVNYDMPPAADESRPETASDLLQQEQPTEAHINSEDKPHFEDASHSDEDNSYTDPPDVPETTLPPSHSPEFMSTRPPMPFLVDRPPSDQERFIAYLPHSGYHNQRIEITNAILMGMMLNRTVLIPYARVGNALGWREKTSLQRVWERDQKSAARVAECQPLLPKLEAGDAIDNKDCEDYTTYSQFSWSYLVNLQKTLSTVPLVQRPDLTFDWFTAPNGLNIPINSIHRVDDPSQYAYKYYASSEVDSSESIGNYETRVNLDDFMTPEMLEKRVIEFGSLYGSYRINLDGADPKWLKHLTQIQDAMVFDLDVVEQVANDIRARMGGRAHHFGMHLRVGDGAFARSAVPHMRAAYLKVLTSLFGFPQKRAEELLKAAEADKTAIIEKRDQVVVTAEPWNWMDHEEGNEEGPILPDVVNLFEEPLSFTSTQQFTSMFSISKRQESTTSQELIKCRRPLYKDPELRPLNAHIYIATDARDPLSDVALAPFFKTFPCAHILSDFDDLPSLQAMRKLRSEEEGLKIAKFLTPILESVMAAGSVRVIGTFGSTFSRFVVSTLYAHYWPTLDERRAAQATLMRSLRNGEGLERL